jgi:hypothetical protein
MPSAFGEPRGSSAGRRTWELRCWCSRSAAALVPAPRDPFAGSAGFAVAYATTPDPTPAWPLLRLGFIGTSSGTDALPRLGIEIPPGARGGPVFDAGGRLAGVTTRGSDGHDRLMPMSMLRREFGGLLGPVTDEAAPPRAPVDGIYEGAMPVTLQVLVEP